MLASSSRDASVCLRCHLRQVLRQLASHQRVATKSTLHQQCRLQSTTSYDGQELRDGAMGEAGESKPRFSMGVGQRTGRNAKRREPRFRQTTATLPISSMNRQTDIIVLHELPKKKPDKRIPHKSPSEEPSSNPETRLSPKEIQSLADQSDRKLSQSEVNTMIESSRFSRDEQIVTRQQFDAKLAELTNAYNLGQLRRYAASQRRFDTVTYTPSAPASTTNHLPASEQPVVRITHWVPTQASKTTPKKQPTGESQKLSKQVFAKQLVAEEILRQCWGIEIDNASNKTGQLEIHLTQPQLHLWMNSTSDALERLQPSSRFYQNSRLQFLPENSLIRISGPQAEAQSMAFTIREAFENSSQTTINLAELSSLSDRDSPLTDFTALFSQEQLAKVMTVTNTFVEFDRDVKELVVSGFADKGVRDAFRLLLSLLPLPSAAVPLVLWPGRHSESYAVVPTTSQKSLRFLYQPNQLGRVVEPVANNGKNDEKRTKKKDGTESDEQDSEPVESAAEGLARDADSRANQNAIAQEVLTHLPEPYPLTEGEETKKVTYWHSVATQMPWKSRLGHILQPTISPFPTTFNPPTTSLMPASSTTAFSPHFPASLSILKHLARLPDFRPGPVDKGTGVQSYIPPPPIRPPTQLIAKLSPSPLTLSGALLPGIFPQVEMIFEQSSETPTSQYTRRNPTTLLEFRSMHAFLAPQQLALHLPSYPTDAQFTRHQLLRSRATQNDPAIATFIAEVLASARDTTSTLHAPQSLDLKIPPWAATPPGLEETKRLNKEQRAFMRRLKNATRDISVPYLFSGFEVRERRDFEIAKDAGGGTERIRIENFSGGVTGGQGVEVSIVAKKSVGVNPRFGDFLSVKLDREIKTAVPMPSIFRGFESAKAIAEKPATEKTMDPQTVGVVRTAVRIVDLIQRIWDGKLVVKPMVKKDRTRDQQTEIYLQRKKEREMRRREKIESGEIVEDRDVFEALDLMDSGKERDGLEAGESESRSERERSVGHEGGGVDEGLVEEVSTPARTGREGFVEEDLEVEDEHGDGGNDHLPLAEVGLGSRL